MKQVYNYELQTTLLILYIMSLRLNKFFKAIKQFSFDCELLNLQTPKKYARENRIIDIEA